MFQPSHTYLQQFGEDTDIAGGWVSVLLQFVLEVGDGLLDVDHILLELVNLLLPLPDELLVLTSLLLLLLLLDAVERTVAFSHREWVYG